MTGTTVTIDSVNAWLAGVGDGKSSFYMILKAYAHEFSHVADANAAPDFMAAIIAACMGDGNNCDFTIKDTTHGTAEALAIQILTELGNPDAYTPDAASDAEADIITYNGNAQENGNPPWAVGTGSNYDEFSKAGDEFQERWWAEQKAQ